MTLPNRSMSVSAGMPVLAVENLRTVLTKERVPHMDHYRHSIDHRKTFFSNITLDQKILTLTNYLVKNTVKYVCIQSFKSSYLVKKHNFIVAVLL